jgi:hypothetical protein
VGWKQLPEYRRPLEKDIADVKGIEHPSPLRVADSEIGVEAGGFGVADVAWMVSFGTAVKEVV